MKTLDPCPQLEKMLDPDPYPDPHKINAEPKPWQLEEYLFFVVEDMFYSNMWMAPAQIGRN
jgi:hypothetical protein